MGPELTWACLVKERASTDGDREEGMSDDRMARAGEGKDTAYEYLCRLEEAKQWLEAVLGVSLPPATELEAALQNGVILCRLGAKLLPDDPVWGKVYDMDESKFKARGLDYRYTDNINFWLISLHKLGLPKIFYPVMTDIYHMRNMPKLVYCIHALSHLLKRQKKIQHAIEDLYGQAEFSPDVISRTSKTLRQSDMPAFSIVDNLVEEELQYQALGLTDSFDEKDTIAVNGSESAPVDGHINGGGEGGKRGREEERERGEEKGGGGGGGFREEDLFDDPKYASSMWIEQTMLKVQRNGSPPESADMRYPFTTTTCQIRDITVHLYAKKSRRKKCPSAVDKALEKINKAMDDEDKKQTFSALQSKDAKLPFLYTDSVDKYLSALRRERKDGVPCNVLVVYSGMTREICVEYLEKMDPGAYIVRSSFSVENAFVFSFRNQTGIKHWQLSDREGKYYWGNSSGFHTLESFVEHFAEALSQVTHLHVYHGMTTALTPQFHTTEQQSMIGRLRAMDDRLGYGQLCRVIKDVNSEIRQGRKESIGRKPVPRKMVIAVNRLQAEEILNREGRPGSFLVRPSEKTPGDYALAFRTTSEVRHWKMVQDGGKFYVHPRPNPYNNLEEIIQHFREAVGQETGLVMTPLVLDWSRTIVKTPNIVVHGESVPSEDFSGVTPDTLLPLPPSPSRLSRGGSEKSSTLGRTSKPSPSMSPLNPANLTSWSVDDVTQWLIQKDLGQFMDIFRDNLVDGECLMTLDNTLLKEDLGITALGYRSRIMKRVKELKSSFEPQQTS